MSEYKNFSNLRNTINPNVEDETPQSGEFSSFLTQNEEYDNNCIHTIKQRLVRIQYPGVIKNLEKALETLGGLKGVAKGVAQNKLEINFHPKNKYNKGVIADTNSNSGLLIKIIKKQEIEKPTWKYEIIGGTVKNFVFNKFVDFQYLPLISKFPEGCDSETFCVYDSIFSNKMEDIDTLLSNEKNHMPLFLPPAGFSRSDIQVKINPLVKSNNAHQNENINSNKRAKIIAFAKPKQPSIFHKFHEVEIPEKPTEFISQLVSRRNYQEYLLKLEVLFRDRPIWTKNGLRFHSNLSNELLKVLLPAVAYHELTGPWRCTWIRFGYDPRKNPESKKYQNLDYRIPYSVRTNLRIGSKNIFNAGILPTSLDKLDKDGEKSSRFNENSFTLRPNVLPTARQVFYQYCDILLPEIQTMLSRLPPVPPNSKCDPKIGWFPASFVDQCREIVSKYIDQQAGQILRKQKESSPSNLLEELCNKTKKSMEEKIIPETKTETSINEKFDVFTIYDSDSDDSAGCEQFYQENDLYDLVDELDDPSLSSEENK